MNVIWIPTQEQCDLIKAAASREAGLRLSRVLLEPGIRYNTDNPERNNAARNIEKGAFNIALISDDPEWNDTDLADNGDWKYFRRGVALTEDGRAIVDFYIRARNQQPDEDSLWGNVSVYYANGRIERIQGYPGEYPGEQKAA